MTDTSNWNYYYKLRPDGVATDSNLLYTPYVNPEGTVMCMHYRFDPKYRPSKEKTVGDDLLDWFFEREVRFLSDLSDLKSTPKLYDVDFDKKTVFIEWNRETLSQIVFGGRNIDIEHPNWKDGILEILKNLKERGYYKMALYPHCFYIDREGNLKTIDYYSVVPFSERFIERRIIEDIIGKEGAYRFDNSTENGLIDFKKFFEITVKQHLTMYWPNSPFPEFFKEVYEND